MVSNQWRQELVERLADSPVHFDAPMAAWTTMKVGGPADALVEGKSEKDILAAMRFAKEKGLPLFIMGKGSNLIVRDGGIRGVVLLVALDKLNVRGVAVSAEAGCRLPFVARDVMQKNLAGLEFAQGIPGSVGGAVIMNAGAYDGEMAQVIRRVRYIDSAQQIVERDVTAADFAYRTSIFAREGWTVLRAEFGLHRDVDGAARCRFDAFRAARQAKQPIEMPSAGSVFKRPEGYFAGQLIEEAGLRGASLGGAQVSPKHAGFIVNQGGATAADVLALIEQVQQRVLAHSGVELQLEVRVVGEPPAANLF